MPTSVPATAARHNFRFGVFELDTQAGELRKSGLRLKLQPQPFQILALLLERAREVVSREELRQRLWPAETYVEFDRSLNRAVVKIREALGDSAESPRFIETLPKRGYRFILPVTRLTTTEITAPKSLQRSTRFRWVALAGILLAAAAIGYLELRQVRRSTSSARIRSIAVLPLEN